MQAEYDKTVLMLSGGAFGISAIIIKDLIGTAKVNGATSLIVAWLAWAFSIIAVLISYYSSASAMEATVVKLDKGEQLDSQPGGSFDDLTRVLNIFSGALFLIGVLCFAYFVFTRT